MEKSIKEQFVAEMNTRLKKAQATFVVDYKGLDVESINKVRGELRKVGVEFQVIKNRLLKLACEGTDTAAIKDDFVGPSAIAIAYDDISEPAKILIKLEKELGNLEIKVGQISGSQMDASAIKRLADLPSRDQLLSQVLSTMQGVTTSFVRVLNGVPLKLVYALKAIEAEKSEQ